MINYAQSGLALVEGAALALSPCILPILPLILASSTSGNRWRPLQIVSGFIISFTIFALISRQILAATGIQQDTIQFGAFLLLLVFGFVMIIPKLEEMFASLTGSLASKAQSASSGQLSEKPWGGFLIGGLIGLVWTPCAGPILAVALLQVIQSQTNLEAVFTIAAFSIGAGIPMLIIGYSGQALVKYVRMLSRHAVLIRRAMGAVIIVFAGLGLMGFNIAEWLVTREAEKDIAAASGKMPAKDDATLQNASMQDVALEGTALQNALEQPYPAPAIAGIHHWLNSEVLDIPSLKGKVVMIDFWTYSCINCIRTLPYVKAWYEKYKDDGFVIIGVHSPEFAFEGKLENVEKAIQKFGITYPVAMDNDFATWKNYKNRYWPAHYLINREGEVVYTHFGEGAYDITEGNIRKLLDITDHAALETGKAVSTPDQTKETYLGFARASNEANLKTTPALPLHHWGVEGTWVRTGQYIQNTAAGNALTLHYRAKKVFLVMESADGKPKGVTVTKDGKQTTLTVTDAKLYDIVLDTEITESTVRIEAKDSGVRMFAFTFES